MLIKRFCHIFRHVLRPLVAGLALGLWLFATAAWGQNKATSIAGTVTDHVTGEAMAFVQVFVPNSKLGTMTDINGRFDLTVGLTDTLVQFRMMGYKPLTMPVPKRGAQHIRVALEPTASTLKEVEVTAKRTKDRYRRKGNPAVELAKQVIAHKEQNSIMAEPHFSRQKFEKLNMCLDQFHPDYEKNLFWKHFPFVQKYVDQAEFDGADILHFSIHERMSSQECIYGRMRTLVTADREDGIDVNLSQEGLNEDLDLLFAPVDIYQNDISLMSVRFVSPLSSALGNAFYHYYITDTVDLDGLRCIELSFVPASKGNFGFVGSMYVADDSSYAVMRYNMRVPEAVDLNFVRDLSVVQTYERDSAGRLLPMRSDLFGRLYIGKKLRQVYVHQLRYCYDYAFDTLARPLPDSLFGALATHARLPLAHKVRRRQWNEMRPLELTLAETFLDSMRYELMRIPSVRHTIHACEALLTSYIPTHAERDSSKFDFGPIYNFVSHNGTEGLRLRLGGMSTARLSDRNFFDGYVAYGFDDRRPKFSLNLIRTFAPKRRFPMEYPLGYVSLHAGYDIEAPGLSFDQWDRDNILRWSDVATPAQYVADLRLRLRKQWPSHFGIDTWVGAQNITPTGLLNYRRLTPTGTERVESIRHLAWHTAVNFSPNALGRGTRTGEGSLMGLTGNSTSISLQHEMGILDGFRYHRSTASIASRLWLSAFGYIDLRAQGGIVWSPVPMPILFTPSGSDSPLLSQWSFNTMAPMEFIMDRYASLMATYHLKGLLLNHLPLIKRLRLREVLTFNILYGSMSEQNDPASLRSGLYLLPQGASFLGSEPYMEYGIGIENIFKLMRIDYVRRLTYLDAAPAPWAVKVTLQFTM